jgi:transcriptional regulator with XRE-family HTH domain
MKMEQDQNLIKRTCKELGITQKELAARMSVAEVTVSDWARGKNPTPAWALRMFNLLEKERQLDAILAFTEKNLHKK